MSRGVGKYKIIDIIHKAVAKAQKDYANVSGSWLWEAPEYLQTTYAYQALMRNNLFALPEVKTKEAMHAAGGIGKGSVHRREIGGRFDLVLYWNSKGDQEPRAIIEFKKQCSKFNEVSSDIDRIIRVLKRNNSNSFKFGSVTFFTSCTDSRNSPKAKLKKWVDRFQDGVDNLKDKHPKLTFEIKNSQIKVEKESDSAWTVVSVIVSKAKEY